jgi:hypothetical protein
MTDHPKPGEDQPGLFDEVVWTAKRFQLLLNYWTMPVLANAKPSESQDVVSVRAFALVVIVALTFAVRGDPLGGKVSYTVLASAVAAALSIGLNLLAKTTRVAVRQPVLVSAYASTILVMLAFLLARTLDGINWYNLLTDWIGYIPAAVCLSVVAVYVALVLKAALWDRNKLSLSAAVQGLAITIGSGLIVTVIYFISGPEFDRLMSLLCSLKNNCA